MKKILIIDWGRWKYLPQKGVKLPKIEQVYPGHTINLVEYDPEVEVFLKENEIKYEITTIECHFPKRIKRTIGKLKRNL